LYLVKVRANMEREAESRAKRLAKSAAWADARDEREATDERAQWWVGELSRELGIVDSRGMIDFSGPIARLFAREYKRRHRKCFE
jgi:hypothetical protein